jgi:hypothetical protein
MQQYMAKVPDSILARNLHACSTFRLQNGKAAEIELQQFKSVMSTSLLGNELVKHNLVVFRGGEHALRDLQPLLGIIPEARLNLVIHYMRKGEVDQAFDLIKDLEPTMPQVRSIHKLIRCTRIVQLDMLKDCARHYRAPASVLTPNVAEGNLTLRGCTRTGVHLEGSDSRRQGPEDA